jgi:uncharacterized membrane protein
MDRRHAPMGRRLHVITHVPTSEPDVHCDRVRSADPAAAASDARRGCFVIKTVQFATLLLFSLVTGVFWGTWFSLSRSMSVITAGTFLEVGRLMIANLGGPMSVLMPAALLAALLLCVFLYRGRHTQAALFASAAFVLMIIALVVTLTVNVPIDRQIQSWTTETLPPDWQAIRDRWEFYHGLRTGLSLAALACLFVSTLGTASRRAGERQVQRADHPQKPRPTAA